MPRAKGSKLTTEHKEKLRESALKHYHERKQKRDKNGEFVKMELDKNDRETNRTSNNENARENDNAEIHISERQTDNRESGKTESLEVEKGVLKTMEIPPKKPLESKEPEPTPESFTCANCQGDISMTNKFCPHCGCQLDWSVAS